jgi:DNA-binding response OmpR family regulator
MLLLESNDGRCTQLANALRLFGMDVLGVTSIAAVEHWPHGQVVVTEGRFLSTWWKRVGATHIILLADRQEDGIAAVEAGAAAWVPRQCDPETLLAAVKSVLTPSCVEHADAARKASPADH